MTRLLLIEDHPQNARSFLRMLLKHGYEALDWEQTGISGLEIALRGTYGAILIDLDLPDLDGMHVGLALYGHMLKGRIPRVPLVALTARTDTSTRAEAERLGFSAWIAKPCTETTLIETLRKVMGAR
ncbi:Response regulator ArlR [Anaerolineae bacterium]|nr:Response regulator ArlR [Anaerolineae bacterium]